MIIQKRIILYVFFIGLFLGTSLQLYAQDSRTKPADEVIPLESAYSNQESAGVVEELPPESEGSDKASGTISEPKRASSNPVKQGDTNDEKAPVSRSKNTAAQNVFWGIVNVLIFIVVIVLFVLIFLYFFRKKLIELLAKSSKERKLLGDILKQVGVDINKILPPPSDKT